MAAADTTQSVECYGVDEIMRKFKLHGIPSHAVFQGNNMLYQRTFDEYDEAESFFLENIKSIHPESKATYTVRLYEDVPDKGIKNNTDYSGMFRFKVSPKQDYTPVSQNQYEKPGKLGAGDERYMNFIERELQEAKARIRELEQEGKEKDEIIAELEDEIEEEPDKLGAMGQLGKAGEQYPWMKDFLTNGMSVLSKFFNKDGNQGGSAPAMGNVDTTGVSPEEIKQMFNQAVVKMHGYYVRKYGDVVGDLKFSQDMAKLANLTDKPMIFEMAIEQLRKM